LYTQTAPKLAMDLDAIHGLMANDMQAVDRMIHERLKSKVSLINQLAFYIVNGGGKRMRPLLVLLSARSLGYEGVDHINLSTVIEFIHTATLLHDDVVDASELRRGQETANAVWGNEASVLVGDFLYSRAFEMMVEVGNPRVMDIMAQTTNTIAEGEVMQLLNSNDADTSEEKYLEVIRCKTAKLFEAAARLGAVVSDSTPEVEQALSAYGAHIGSAFQLIDDVLDYSASADQMGKNIGDDLAEGRPTLPLIHAMRVGTPHEAALIRHAIEKGGRENIEAVMQAVESTDALTYTARAAQREAQLASRSLAQIPSSPYRDALYALAEFSVKRDY